MQSSIRTVVAGVAGVDGADPVLAECLALCRRLGAALHAVHAYTPPDAAVASGIPMADFTGTGAAIVGSPAMAESVEEGLRARLREQAPGAEVHVEPGSASAALARVAEEVGADLVVLGATHRGRLERALLGSTTDRALREVHAPVLVLRRPLAADGARVLLTTDLGEASAAAAARGVEMARALFADASPTLRALHSPALVPGDVPPDEARNGDASEGLRRFVAGLPGGGEVEPVTRRGAPADEIVAEAESWPADLVVLGTHARTGIQHLILGSVAERVAREAPCNALVIPPVAR